MKKTIKDPVRAAFSEYFPMSEQDRKVVFDFYEAYVKSVNVPVKPLPRHLIEPLHWLVNARDRDTFRLIYPAGKPPKKPPEALYVVRSMAREIQKENTVYHNLTIGWIYTDQKNRPLVDYSHSIRGCDHLNHWGLLNSIQCLDESFSASEANLLKKYLDRDKRMMRTKIIRLKLPHQPGYISMALIADGRLNLYEEEGYDLPFKVEGLFIAAGYPMAKSKATHARATNEASKENPLHLNCAAVK